MGMQNQILYSLDLVNLLQVVGIWLLTSAGLTSWSLTWSSKTYRLDIRKRFITKEGVRHWNSLPREVVMVLSLVEYKQHLDNTLRHVLWFLVVLRGARSWNLMILKGPFQLGTFCVLWYRSNFPFSPLMDLQEPVWKVQYRQQLLINTSRDLGRTWVLGSLLQSASLQSGIRKNYVSSVRSFIKLWNSFTLYSSVTHRTLHLGNCFLIYAFHIIHFDIWNKNAGWCKQTF